MFILGSVFNDLDFNENALEQAGVNYLLKLCFVCKRINFHYIRISGSVSFLTIIGNSIEVDGFL